MKKSIIVAAVISVLAAWAVQAEDGKALYDQGVRQVPWRRRQGRRPKWARNWAQRIIPIAKVQDALKDDAAIKAIKEGLKKDDKTLMKPAEGLTDDQIKGLVAYLRTFKK